MIANDSTNDSTNDSLTDHLTMVTSSVIHVEHLDHFFGEGDLKNKLFLTLVFLLMLEKLSS